MKKLYLDEIFIQNFKGIEELHINFNQRLTILKGMNATGKTSVYDAVSFLLFNKDSHGNAPGTENFEIRTLDANNEKIHHNVISVTGRFRLDDVPYELKKEQHEKWTKRRGSEESELTGNQNKFFINDFPKGEKEYLEFIKSIIDEKTFRLLTDPMAFLNTDWKEQRAMLMSFVDDVPEGEVAKSVENFNLIASDVKQASLDDCRKKYTNANSKLKNEQKKYLTLLEELPGMKIQIDVKGLTEEKDKLDEVISGTEQYIKDNPLPSVGEYNQQIASLESEIRVLENTANAERMDRMMVARREEDSLTNQLRELESKRDHILDQMAEQEKRKASLQSEFDRLEQEFKAVKAMKFDENQNVCRFCGQALPSDKVEENRKKFQDLIESKKKDINLKAAGIKKELSKIVPDLLEEMPDERGIQKLSDARNAKKKEISDLSVPIDISQTDEYQEIMAKIDAVKKQIAELDDAKRQRSEMESELSERIRERNAVIDKLADTKVNAHIDEQIAEAKESLRDVSQKLLDSEKYVFVLDNYIRFIAEKINERFDGLTFKLFETQLNGGIKDTCSILVNGVPYKSLNSGHRIVIGQKVILSLQTLFDIKVPVWIDNAETINDDNLVDMGDAQMILLRVSDDKTLVVIE